MSFVNALFDKHTIGLEVEEKQKILEDKMKQKEEIQREIQLQAERFGSHLLFLSYYYHIQDAWNRKLKWRTSQTSAGSSKPEEKDNYKARCITRFSCAARYQGKISIANHRHSYSYRSDKIWRKSKNFEIILKEILPLSKIDKNFYNLKLMNIRIFTKIFWKSTNRQQENDNKSEM